MGPPGNASHLCRGTCRADELKHKPYADKEKGREFYKIRYKKDGNEGQYPGFWVKQEIRTHNTGNGAAGANGGYLRVPVDEKVEEARGKATKEVERKVPYGPQPVFHVIAEYIERPHVAEKVPEAPVKEHEREKGNYLLTGGKVGSELRNRVAGRNKSICNNKPVQSISLRYLHEIKQHVCGDNDSIDHRIIFGLNCVTNGDHRSHRSAFRRSSCFFWQDSRIYMTLQKFCLAIAREGQRPGKKKNHMKDCLRR